MGDDTHFTPLKAKRGRQLPPLPNSYKGPAAPCCWDVQGVFQEQHHSLHANFDEVLLPSTGHQTHRVGLLGGRSMGEAAWGCWACWVGVGQTGLHRRQNVKESLSRTGATRLAQPLPLFSTSGVVSREGKRKGGGRRTTLELPPALPWQLSASGQGSGGLAGAPGWDVGPAGAWDEGSTEEAKTAEKLTWKTGPFFTQPSSPLSHHHHSAHAQVRSSLQTQQGCHANSFPNPLWLPIKTCIVEPKEHLPQGSGYSRPNPIISPTRVCIMCPQG